MISTVECLTYYFIVNLPFYYPVKLAALMWLCSRSTGGSKYLYRWCIAPTMAAYREQIDDALEQSQTSIKNGVQRCASRALEASAATGHVGISTLKRTIS